MPSLELESPQSVSFTVRNRASFTPSRKRRASTTAILRLSANSAERHSGQYTTTSAGSSSSSGTPANRARSPETRPHSLHSGRRVSLAEQAATSHPVRGRGDTDALIKLRVACDLAITAAHELGDPLPPRREEQINELCHAIQAELESPRHRLAEGICRRPFASTSRRPCRTRPTWILDCCPRSERIALAPGPER